ncbi:hypothetical protein ACQBJO_10895 [Janibacter sp. G349]|uniref:hypothetical protein n=1 Tax=unclassified Janibacter TaxID=2649294 RepID=UPI003B7AE8DC
MKALRLLTGLVATLLLLGGVAVAILLGPDDTWRGEPAALPDSAPVIATAPQLLNVAGIDLVVSARASTGEVFVGAGHPVHVQDYLDGVTHTEIDELSADGVGGSQPRDGDRAYPAAPPADLDVWEEQQVAQDVTVAVPLTEEAPVQVVALPAKAGGAAPEVGIGYGLPGAFVAGLVAAVVGLLLLVGTVVWGRRAKRARRTAPATAPEALAESAPAQATTVTRGATRVAAVGVVAVLAAGCSIPQQVDHGKAPGVVPLEAADAQAALDDYDVRNNAAIKASHTGDGSRWRAADAGPVLAKDLVEAKTNAVDRPTTKAVTFTHEVEETFAAPQSAYPQWFVVSYTSSPDPESKGVGLSLQTRDHVTEPWRGYSSVWVDEGAPTPLPPAQAAPSADDLERAEEVDDLLATWVEEGEAPGLQVTKELADHRAEMNTTSRGVSRFANSSDPWGGAEDRTAPGGSVRAVRVKEGLLVLTDQEWENRGYLEADFQWRLDATDKKVFPQQDETNVYGRDFALSAAILVPDSGDARVLGARAPRVLGFPR